MLTILLITIGVCAKTFRRKGREANAHRRSTDLLAIPLLLTLATSAYAGVADAVVQVEGCSGVCVDPSGLVLTVKHCNLPTTVTVRFKDRTVSAKRVYVCRETEGPVVYLCDGTGFSHLPVAASPPRVGERLWSYGYPEVGGRRELRYASGPLLRWSSFQYNGGSFNGNVVRFGTCPGWSGGPLLNAKAEVCGLLNSTDGTTSIFVSSASVRQAYAAAKQAVEREPRPRDGKPTLYVFGSISCGPCRQFKSDYDDNTPFRRALDATFSVQFVDIDKRPEMAKRYGIKEVPTFIVPGRERITGYEGPDALLVRLGIRQKIAPRPPPQREIGDDPVADEKKSPPPNAEPDKPVDGGKSDTTDEPEPPEDTSPSVDNFKDSDRPASEVPPSRPAKEHDDRLDHVAGLVEKAVTLATWLGITGATGGAGGLILGGIALWRTVRRRRKQRPARDPPSVESVPQKPQVVTVDSPPPPQAVVRETRFAPYERDTFAEAFAWAETEMARKYPGSVGTMESIKGLIDQYLAGRGVKRDQ